MCSLILRIISWYRNLICDGDVDSTRIVRHEGFGDEIDSLVWIQDRAMLNILYTIQPIHSDHETGLHFDKRREDSVSCRL